MDNQELAHWGIKGMKWGRRRYQNADGSLTPAGEKRYSRDRLDNNNQKLEANPNKWVREDISRTKKLVDAGSTATNELKKVANNSSKKVPKMDLSSMTDQEMRNAINRAMLERQYDDMFNPQKTSRGREVVNSVLENAGSVLAVTSSALGIALAIKELKG